MTLSHSLKARNAPPLPRTTQLSTLLACCMPCIHTKALGSAHPAWRDYHEEQAQSWSLTGSVGAGEMSCAGCLCTRWYWLPQRQVLDRGCGPTTSEAVVAHTSLA